MSIEISSIMGAILLILTGPQASAPPAPEPAAPIQAPTITQTTEPPAELTCSLMNNVEEEAHRYEVRLTAGDSPASGSFRYSFEQGGTSQVRLVRGGSFNLAPGETVTLGSQRLSLTGTEPPELEMQIDGAPVACGPAR